jgi:hypothetical protein
MSSTGESQVLPPALLRALYRWGLDLGPDECVAIAMAAPDGTDLVLLVRNAFGGIVEVTCSDVAVGGECADFCRDDFGFQLM